MVTRLDIESRAAAAPPGRAVDRYPIDEQAEEFAALVEGHRRPRLAGLLDRHPRRRWALLSSLGPQFVLALGQP